MKTRIKSVIVMACLFVMGLLTHDAQAQDYKTALGIRAGGTSGFTIKHFYERSTAAEGIVGFFGNGMSITGLIEKQTMAFETDGLQFYYGGGAHLAFYNGKTYYNHFWRDTNYTYGSAVALGVDGALGFEYTLPDVPLSFSIDLKPFVEFGSGGYVGFSPDPSIGVKLIIK